MSSRNWLSGLAMPEPHGNTSHLDDLGLHMTPAGLPKRVPFATVPNDDLDAPVPCVPVDVEPEPLPGLRLPVMDEKAIVDALASAAESWSRGASSQAGLQAVSHGPTISSGGAVTKPNPAPSDDSTPSLVQLDRAEAAARVLNAAMSWEASEHGTPWDHADAEQALRDAVRAYRPTVTE